MHPDAQGFFKMKRANREPREMRERIRFHSVFAYSAYFAIANTARLKIVATSFPKRARLPVKQWLANNTVFCEATD
jgi:hypothetical protein